MARFIFTTLVHMYRCNRPLSNTEASPNLRLVSTIYYHGIMRFRRPFQITSSTDLVGRGALFNEQWTTVMVHNKRQSVCVGMSRLVRCPDLRKINFDLEMTTFE